MAVRGRVDGMQGRHVTGWAMPVAGSGPCAVTVTDEAGIPVVSGEASRRRADLAALGAGRDDLAFSLALPACEARRMFHVHADGVELPGSPLEAGPGRYDGDCMVDGGVLKGWVRERIPNLAEPGISIVTQHGVIVGQGQSVRAVDAPHERAAFEVELDNPCFGAGELRLRVLADGVKFAEVSCELPLRGNIDRLTPEYCAGWLVAPDAPARSLEIEIFRDGIAVAIARCGNRRQDVRDLHPDSNGGGFAASFPRGEEWETQPASISLRLRGSGVELFDGPFIVAGREAAVLAAQRAARATLGHGTITKSVIAAALQQFVVAARTGEGFVAKPQVAAAPAQQVRMNIIIPVYGDVSATQICIDAVLANRFAATDRVILINDASPEPGMAALLDKVAGEPNVFVLTNTANLGFIKTVNRGFAFAGAGDVLLLNADTIVFPGAFDELHSIAHSAEDVATVTAMSNDATIFCYPGDQVGRPELADIGWAKLAEVALAANAGVAVEVPTGHGFCMLITGEVLRRVGIFDESFGRGYCEENDFCVRAADLGYRHVAAAGVFVQHCGSLSFGQEKAALVARNLVKLAGAYPEYFPVLREFTRRDGLRSARWALDVWRLKNARRLGAEFVLVVSNSLGGGSAKAALEIEQAAGYGSAVRLSLNCRHDGGIELFAAAPVFHARFAADEQDALFELLGAAAPRRVLVHQLLGFPEGLIRRLLGWSAGRESAYYLHDFYALCPRVTLIDAIGDFCNVAETDVCERCVAIGGAHADSRLRLDEAGHRALFGQLLRGFSQVIAPSASAADLLRRGLPDLQVDIVPHPDPGLSHGSHAVRQAEDDAEIVLFGALGPHKGSGKLLEVARRARLTHPWLSFRVIGYTSLDAELLATGNVTITGRYSPETLPKLVAEAQGTLALFLHEWPETYSYTLSEAVTYGLIPLVPDIGAPADRVRAMGFGVVYPFPADAATILQVIQNARSK